MILFIRYPSELISFQRGGFTRAKMKQDWNGLVSILTLRLILISNSKCESRIDLENQLIHCITHDFLRTQ